MVAGHRDVHDVADDYLAISNNRRRSGSADGENANAFGLYDMSGNVWEWCQDWHGDYSSREMTDPTGVGSGGSRVLRGGSWGYITIASRSAGRFGNPP